MKGENFQVANNKGELLCATFIEPFNDEDRSGEKMPCIIYMHGNAGNLTEGLQYDAEVVSRGFNFCCFDFSGSGNSEGEIVTLGYNEKEDLKAMIEYLQEYKRVSNILLWGRSMGAVTSLFYMAENPGAISCALLDSPFASLDKIVQNMAGMMGIPPEFVQMLYPMMD